MDMRFLRELIVLAIILLCGLAACTTKQNPQEFKEKTARATAELKVDAKAVAAGVREGWSRDKPLDLKKKEIDQKIPAVPPFVDANAIGPKLGPDGTPVPRTRQEMLTEGTYPHVRGGVSVWCDQMIKGLNRHRFHLVSLTATGREPALYELPENVDSMHSLPIWTPGDYEVIRQLPSQDADKDVQYRIKSVRDGHERIVKESDLR